MRILATLAIAIITALGSAAVDINNTAGGLSANLAGQESVSSLTVTGTVNASDLQFIRDNLTSLTTLNLSDATVVAYSGPAILEGRTDFPANTLPAYSLFGTPIKSLTLPSSLKAIGEGALASSALTSLQIPSGVTEIGDNALASCTSLTKLTVPATALAIGEGLAMQCTKLKDVTLTAQVDAIGARWFEGCTALTSITIPLSVKAIGASAFMGSGITSLTFPSALTAIADKAFYDSSLKTADMSTCNSLASIGDYAFALCDDLTTVSLPERAISLGAGIFFDDSALRTVHLPASTTTIPEFTFKGTSSIDASNLLPDAVAHIDQFALAGWTSTKTIILPEDLESLGTGAMEGWSALEVIYADHLPVVPTLGEDVWEDVDQPSVKLYVALDMVSQFEAADQWREFIVQARTTESTPTISDDLKGEVRYILNPSSLLITSSGSEIEKVNIYDLEGRRRASVTDHVRAVEIDTDGWGGKLLIVEVRLADGTRSTAKLTF